MVPAVGPFDPGGCPRQAMIRGRALPVAARAIALVLVLAAGGLSVVLLSRASPRPVPSFRDQACGIPAAYLQRTKAGYFESRSGQIQLIPRQPAYFSSGAGGWSHSGPWPYLQDVPLVFYGPGVVPAIGDVSRPATVADIAPTIGRLIGAGDLRGPPLPEVTRPATGSPKLVVTVVWDGGGWNTLRQWPRAWPNLARLMRDGVSFTNATVGSSPSVTPSVHTTIGTGALPKSHGITDIPVFDENRQVVDSFVGGESSRFIKVPALAESWDEANDNHAIIGMVGYEPWHLGMIGQGAERSGGDKDHGVWLDIETNEWITNPAHYSLPDAVAQTSGLDEDVRALDAADGEIDGAWGEHAILDERDRLEEVPAFITYHGRVLRNMIAEEGYGDDDVADLLFTNFKQIDRVGHYFNMASEEVRDSVVESDRQLGKLVHWLEGELGHGNYAVVVTADHGQQPDEDAVNGYGIDPKAISADMVSEFGPIVRTVRPTQVFLNEEVMRARNVSVEEVARWLADYRLEDNTDDPRALVGGAGVFERGDRLFDMIVPSKLLSEISCG
jgi:arylsulfatase A-like enzyme